MKKVVFGCLVLASLVGIVGLKTKLYVDSITDRVWQNRRGYSLVESSRFLGWEVNLVKKIFKRDEFDEVSRVLPLLPNILAEGGHKEYVVLLQNNMELRPTGGFLGSYARVSFTDGFLEDLKLEDIYVPDGQLLGYVQPPQPIYKYLNSSGWFLRDSNWDPDFTKAAPIIEWFFVHGKEEPVDGIVAVNLFVVQELLRGVGPIYLSDYRETLTADNLFEKAEAHSEVDFFPGSTQKRDFLSQVADQSLEKIKAADWRGKTKLVEAIHKSLRSKHMLIWMKDEAVSKAVRKLNWDGKLVADACQGKEKCLPDYLMIVEANLGVNKTNCCLEREIAQDVNLTEDGELERLVKIDYKNNNPIKPEPPKFWGGGYKNYLRVYLPKESKLEGVKINNKPLQSIEVDQEVEDEFLVVGFLVEVGGGETGQVTISYSQPIEQINAKVYRLKVQKQSGTNDDPYTLTFHSPTCPDREIRRFLSGDGVEEIGLECN